MEEIKVKVTDELMENITENFRDGLQGFMTMCVYPAIRSLLNSENEARELAATIGYDLSSNLEDYAAIDQVLPIVMDRHNTEFRMKGTKDEYTSSLDKE